MPTPHDHGSAARRTLIEIARRRQRPGTGSLPHGRTARLQWPELGKVLRDVPWAIVGAVATRRYMPERATTDLDIAILPADAPTTRVLLEAAGFVYQAALSIGGTAWRAPDGTPVDVIEGHEAWWQEALADAATNRDEQGSPILPLPYLVLMKLTASRVQDIADVTRMLGGASDDDLARVRAIAGRHAADLREDIESLISLGRMERDA